MAVIAAISLWTHPAIARRWFVLPNRFYFLPVPLLVLFCSGRLWRGIKRRADVSPFMMTLILVFLGFSGLGISIWPYIIPPSIDIRAASAPAQSQGFMLVGALLIIPVILMYTFWSYFVFRVKINPHEGYH